MSSKPKKQGKKAEAEPKVPESAALERPVGPVPTASVMSRHGEGMISRDSKGFSHGEIESAGMVMLTARRWGLPMDVRRSTVLTHNVEALKTWCSKAKAQPAKTAGGAAKIGEELEKAAKEVKKEAKKAAAKAKKEAKKVEEVGEEAAEKVEKAVKKGKKKAPKKSEE